MTRKLLSELPMLGLGSGLAVTGISIAVIAAGAIKKNFYVSGVALTVGVYLGYVGSEIAIGAVERVRGLQ